MVETPTSMKKVQSSLRDEIVRVHQENEATHTLILDKLSAYETELRVRNTRDEEKAKAEQSLRKQIFTLAVLFMSILSGLVAWAAMEFNELHHDIGANTAHFREFQAIGIEWGDNIDERAQGFKEDIRQLRRSLNEHQRQRENAHHGRRSE